MSAEELFECCLIDVVAQVTHIEFLAHTCSPEYLGATRGFTFRVETKEADIPA
jgi:hypothetical protein